MLMKAEAEVQLAGNVDPNAITPEQKAHYRNAFSLVSAVYNRANNIVGGRTDTLVFNNFANNRITMEDLVLKERQRELLFEGKRWFDLVRLARREGNNNRLVNYAVNKYVDNQSAMRKKLNAPMALYFPYGESELKVNPNLKQNPAYETGSTTNITD
ncbi:MAG: SusD family protein [Bacteroidetes bacterium ADurb.Bin416]|nr:MAG: SusD family protein [Bacteroidetes bacterium ADurb.Bin416]